MKIAELCRRLHNGSPPPGITRRWWAWYALAFWLLVSAAFAVGPLHQWGWI